jgi:hypothetical protein
VVEHGESTIICAGNVDHDLLVGQDLLVGGGDGCSSVLRYIGSRRDFGSDTLYNSLYVSVYFIASQALTDSWF